MPGDLDDYGDLDGYPAQSRRWNADLARWRGGILAAMEEFADAGAEREPAADPVGAPAAYRRVRDRVRDGELDWLDVVNGEVEDPDARAVHLWLAERLDVVRRALAKVSGDMSPERARAVIDAAIGGGRGLDR